MKKTVAIFLVLGALLSFSAFFTGCGNQHDHEFNDTWMSDDTYHWYECTFDGCMEFKDRSEHVWQDILILGDATITSDGKLMVDQTEVDGENIVKIDLGGLLNDGGKRAFMCEECGYYKANTETYVSLTETEWNSMLDSSNFENYTLEAKTHTTITTLTDGSEMIVDAIETMRFADGKVYSSVSSVVDGNESTDERLSEGEEATFITTSNATIFASLKYEYFNFNTETNQYVAKQAIEIPVLYIYYGVDGEMDSKVSDTQLWKSVVVEISNGNLKTISYTSTILSEELGTSMAYETVYTFSDYGTTTISDTGSSLKNQLNEEEWDAMLDQARLENYTLNYEAEYIVKDFSNIEQERVKSASTVRMTIDKIAEREIDCLSDNASWSNWYVSVNSESYKFTHEWMFLTLLKGRYNDWVYDSEKEVYYAPNGIHTICELDTPLLIEISSGEVRVSEDGKLLEFVFKATVTDETYELTWDGNWGFLFSEYGTTVISENITPDPPIPDPINDIK